MESNNSSSYTCNPNVGPDGGATAGTWQFTYRWAIPGFWAKYGYDKKYPLPNPAVDYEGFKRQWLAAVNENPTQFFNNEHEHVINSYYEPVRQRAAAGGADPNRISRAAQESLLAGSIRLGQEGALRAWNSSSRDANYWQGYYPAMAAATASQGSDGGRYTDNDSYSEVRLIKGMLNQAPMAPPYRGGKGGFGERAQGLIDGTKTLKDYPIPIRESFKGFSESKKKFDELAKQSENGPGEFSKLIFSRPFAGGYGVNDAKAEPQAIHKAKIARVIAQNKERLRKAKNRKLVEARGGFGAYSTIGDETILQTLTSDHSVSDLIMKGNILLSKQLDRLEAIATYLQSLVGISSETKEILESKTPITQQTGKASDPKRGDLTITKSNPTPPKHNNPDIDDSNASFYDQMNFELAKRIAMGR